MSGTVTHTLPAPPGLIECGTVLDVGAGIRPMRWYTPTRHICVEPFGPYADVLEAAGHEVIRQTAEEALDRVGAEAIYLLDVLEHMEREEGQRVLELARRSASRQVVVFTPLGFVEQTHDAWNMGGEHWQTHRSGWTPDDFPEWQTHLFRDKGLFALWEPNTHS